MHFWSNHRTALSRLVSMVAVLGACVRTEAPPGIHVVAGDYAFQSPEAARPGPTVFTLENRGAKDHEMFIGLLRPEATAPQILAAHRKGLGFRQLPDVHLDGAASAALFAAPGTTSAARVTLDLLRGRSYVLFCQLRDSIGAPQHAALGMFRVLRID